MFEKTKFYPILLDNCRKCHYFVNEDKGRIICSFNSKSNVAIIPRPAFHRDKGVKKGSMIVDCFMNDIFKKGE